MAKRKARANVPLDEVFSKSEKDPRWKRAYAEADLEVQLALQIAKAREQAHMTQGELAKTMRTTQSAVSRMEHGGQNLTIAYLGKIAQALNRQVYIELR